MNTCVCNTHAHAQELTNTIEILVRSNSFLLYLNDTNKCGLALLQADHKVSLSCPPSILDNFSASQHQLIASLMPL